MNPYKYTPKTEFNFNNPDDFKKLEQMAYDMTIEIDNFPPEAYRYFDRLRTLYARFKYGNLSKEMAEAEKKKLYSDYIEAKSAYQLWCSVYGAYQDNIRKAGTMLSDIEKSKDTEDIALKACEVIGIMTGDKSFAKRQERKIKNG